MTTMPTSPDSTVGQRAFMLAADPTPLRFVTLAMAMLGIHLTGTLCGNGDRLTTADPQFLFPGVKSLATLAARTQTPLCMAEDEYSVTTTIGTSALVPQGIGAVHVDVTLFCSSDNRDFEFADDITSPLYVQILWMAVGGADHEPVLAAVLDWLESVRLPPNRDDDEEAELPDVLLSEQLEGLHERIVYRERLLEELTESTSAKATRAAAEEHRRVERKLTTHIKQLQMELETSRAVSERLRARAETAERMRREPLTEGTPPASVPPSVTAEPVDVEQQKRLELVIRQQSDQIDQLRAEVFRLRSERSRDGGTQGEAAEILLPTAPPTASFKGLASWAQANLRGRVVVHAKAARAARKSAFNDHALVYRVLQAMAEHYWSMRAAGDAGARLAWETFLTAEHLTCGPTGAAVLDRRTRPAYLVNWHRRSVELDQHIQGDSSRDEARAFRLYFHWDTERSVVVVGHLPSHLPNTFT
ncbi:hypothetical protein AB7849_15630 [Rhodanobacter sp. 115]|uniref:hypothetical protein n=1 Tax=Rhodanobacter sp. FW021-MT20 TaxID=1162282 RepID=UPI0034E38025